MNRESKGGCLRFPCPSNLPQHGVVGVGDSEESAKLGNVYNLSTKGLAAGTHTLVFTAAGDSGYHSLQFQVRRNSETGRGACPRADLALTTSRHPFMIGALCISPAIPVATLLQRARGRPRRARRAFRARHTPLLRRWAAGRLPQWARHAMDTVDLVQETMLAFRNLESFERRGEGDAAIAGETVARYEAALERLPDDVRAAVVARVELRLGYAEIAELLDKPSADAARMTVARALVKLAEEMNMGDKNGA